jgi:hypothetical protein
MTRTQSFGQAPVTIKTVTLMTSTDAVTIKLVAVMTELRTPVFDRRDRLTCQKPAGIGGRAARFQLETRLRANAVVLLQLFTGRRPTRRVMELVQWYLLGWASARIFTIDCRATAPVADSETTASEALALQISPRRDHRKQDRKDSGERGGVDEGAGTGVGAAGGENSFISGVAVQSRAVLC